MRKKDRWLKCQLRWIFHGVRQLHHTSCHRMTDYHRSQRTRSVKVYQKIEYTLLMAWKICFKNITYKVRLRLVHHSNLLSCEIHLRHIVVDNFIPCRAWSLLVSVSVPAEMWDFKLQLRPYSIFYLFLVQSIAHNLVEGTRGKSRGNEFHLLSLSTRFQRYGIRILHM